MKIIISIPNDYGSESDTAAAIQQCYGSDSEAALNDECRECYEVLALAAKDAGLEFVGGTDYGAEWEGSPAQCEAAISALPGWAHVGEVEGDDA